MAAVIALQRGHCFRKTGATGGRGEQKFADQVGRRLEGKLAALGHTVYLLLADEPVPRGLDVFIALHTDGSVNAARHGASIGFNTPGGERLGKAWQRAHQRAGYRWGFLPANYTRALAGYYGFGRSDARFEFLAEHGHHSNNEEFEWMHANYDAIADAHVAAIGEVVGHPITPRTEALVTDPTPTSEAVHDVELSNGAVLTLARDGAVFSEPAGAHYYGSPTEPHMADMFAPAVALVPTEDELGYWIVSEAGEIHNFGSAPVVQPYTPLFREWQLKARRIVNARRARLFRGLVLTSNYGEHYDRPAS